MNFVECIVFLKTVQSNTFLLFKILNNQGFFFFFFFFFFEKYISVIVFRVMHV